MIHDLSKSLEAILTQPGLPSELAAARIVFDRPVENFAPQQTAINLFLYDIRENTVLRSNEPAIERRNGQAIVSRPPLRVDCTYLITAWPVGGTELPLQEHRLLSQVLQVLSRYPTIPNTFLQGSLRGQEPPLPLIITSADGLKNPAEFWSSLGTPLRASLAVTVTVALKTMAPVETLPLAITHELRWGEETSFQIGGRVTDASGQPIAGAKVALQERNLSASTDAEGIYRLGSLAPGTYTLQLSQVSGTARNFPITVPAIAGSNYNIQLSPS
jgi:hypothetical protein